MNRVVLALGIVTTLLLVSRPAPTCTMSWGGPHFGPPGDLLPNGEFRLWAAFPEEVRLELYDPAGRVVPTDVVTHSLPVRSWGFSPGTYAVVRPRKPLVPGTYQLGYAAGLWDAPFPIPERTRRSLTVAAAPVASHPPTAIRQLSARPMRERCVVNSNADCSPMYGDCAFLMLDFQAEGGVRQVYEVGWEPWPAAPDSGRGRHAQGFSSEAARTGRRIRIPIWWLEGLGPQDREIRLQVRAVDATGAAGPVASLVIDAEPVRRLSLASKGVREFPVRSVETRYATDVGRFLRAAAPGSVAALELLSGDSSPRGEGADRAFAAAVLSSDEPLWLRGHVRGHEGRTRVRMLVRVRAGRVHGAPAGEEMRAILAALPFDVPEVERMDLVFESLGGPSITMQVAGESVPVQASWSSIAPPDLRGLVRQRLETWRRLRTISQQATPP